MKQIREKNVPGFAAAVTGVVIATDALRIYIQDHTGALGVIRAGLSQAVRAGEMVEVEGTITQAGPALGLSGLSLTRLGQATLPPAEPHSAEALAARAANSQFVRVSGTVHEVGVEEGKMLLQVQSGSTSFLVTWLYDPAIDGGKAAVPRVDLLDAEVTLQGAACPQFDSFGVRSGFRLVLASSSHGHLLVTKPGTADPFSLPLQPISSLSGIKSHENTRRRLRGVVTYWSDAGWFHIHDESGNARVNNSNFITRGIGWPYRPSRSEPALKPGDEVEVVGLPAIMPTGQVALSRSEWRVLGTREPPAFSPVQAASVRGPAFDGLPAMITGRVLDATVFHDYQGFAVHTLWMAAGESPFSAIVQKRQAEDIPVSAGDYVRLDGVISTAPGYVGRGPFRVNLNSFADVHLLPPPSGWHGSALVRWLPLIVSVMALAAVWILLLRRQVAVQTFQLRQNAARLEEQLERERELGEMKSRFVFTVSHEFRNPLAAILSCSDVLQRLRDRISPQDYSRQIDGIQQNVHRMAAMMEEVLLFGRAESGRLACDPQPLHLEGFCQALIDHIRSAGNEHRLIRLVVHEPLPALLLDASLLTHIISNLLGNAVKYSPDDSAVLVDVRYENGTLFISVQDRGPGISVQERKHIFEPFQRGTNTGETTGSGLGLAIAERCARAHGGRIAIEEVRDGGASFVVSIPTSPAI